MGTVDFDAAHMKKGEEHGLTLDRGKSINRGKKIRKKNISRSEERCLYEKRSGFDLCAAGDEHCAQQ